MNWINYNDVVIQLESLGLVCPKKGWQVDTLKPVRCEFKNATEPLRGWFHLANYFIDGDDYIVGAYGYWEGDNNNKYKIELSKKCNACGFMNAFKAKECAKCSEKSFKSNELTKEQKEALAKQRAEAARLAAAEILREKQKISDIATKAWYQLSKEGDCSYLQRKGVDKYSGLRYGTGADLVIDIVDNYGKPALQVVPNDKDSLIFPIHDARGVIWGLQIIRGAPSHGQRQKDMWPPGCKMGEHYFTIGKQTPVQLLAEGLATALTLYQATGLQTHVVFNANNMPKAAEHIHKFNKNAKLLMCADDDYLLTCKNVIDETNGAQCLKLSPVGTENCPHCAGVFKSKGRAGERYAQDAAIAVGGAWIKPEFPFDREGKKLTDFNDLSNFANCSNSTVTVQIEDKLHQLGWGLDAKPKAQQPQQGGGVERQSAVSIMELDDAVERFIPLDDGTGKYVFDTRTNKIALRDQMIALLPAGVRWDDVKRHHEWINRGAYYLDEIGFDPTGVDVKVKLNTWTGWELTPKQGTCDKLLETLEYLCSKEKNSDEVLWWILKWMAYPLQNPGAKMLSAIILHGPQGTGKSLIFRTLASIYGKYATVIGNRGIEDKFNADWADSKLFILAEEVATSADKWQIKNELKELVTGETVRVNPKNIAAYSQKNQMNLAFLSNEDMPLPIENDDRRHLVVYTPDCLPEKHYIDTLIERDEGGIEAFYYFLMKIDLTGFNRYTKPPSTMAKENLIAQSLPSDKRFIKEWIDGQTIWPAVPCLSMDLYRAYLTWCKQNGETRPRPSNSFLGMVANLTGWKAGKDGIKRIHEDLNFNTQPKQRCLVIPPQITTKGSGEHKTVTVIYAEKKLNETEQQWLTGFVVDFKNAENRGETDN